jgi:hypothetical protein
LGAFSGSNSNFKEKKMKKLMIAIAALAMFASSAYAADWNFYGNVRFYTFYETVDQQTPGSEDIDGLVWTSSPYSRIGANIKVSDELTGRFEYDIAGGNARVRILWGEWNFGSGKLAVGQNWTLTNIWGSNQLGNYEDGLGGYGEMGGFRASQIRLTFGDFALALVETNTDFTDNSGIIGGSTTEVKMPAIQAKYVFKGDAFNVSGVAAYSTFDADTTATTSDDVTAYLFGIGADMAVGGFTFYASVHGGNNIGNLQNDNATGGAADGAIAKITAAGVVVDNQTISYRLVANYAMNDMMSFEVGYGFAENEFDEANSVSDKCQSYYVNMPIVVAPGVIITPEVGVYDQDEDLQDKTTYFGVHWRMNF